MNTVPALLEKAAESLRAARLLASEGHFDFAVSRSYFIMHYVAEAFLLTIKLDVHDPDGVVDAFGQRFTFTNVLPPVFYHWLLEAEALRNKADFETDTGITAEIVAEQIDRARAFMNVAREELADVR